MKDKILKLLEAQVRRYFKKKPPRLVVVTGSVGKTGTKTAIAAVLRQNFKVRAHGGNHNTHFSVPTALLGVPYPANPRSVYQWLKVLLLMRLKSSRSKDVDVIVQELGTDAPGDIPHFMEYLKPDITVVTAVSPEHMEFFKDLDAVAQEELSVAAASGWTLINRDDISEQFARYAATSSISTYGLSSVAEYRFIVEDRLPEGGFKGELAGPEIGSLAIKLNVVGEHSLKPMVAAAAVGARLGLSSRQIAAGLESIEPVSGRMRLLRGMNDSILIDDSYNSSPLAAAAALKTLYDFKVSQRVAILGSMNELGAMSPQLHENLGKLCDPKLLAWVVTVGKDAAEYLAPAAARRGCQVRSFISPYEAGAFVHKILEPGAVVLAKGSQNGVFCEEALKMLLHSTEDEFKLVRQSPQWLAKKRAQFFKDAA